jgi:hypothetical protein
MSVSELHLAFPDGRLDALDSPRFQALRIRLGDLFLRADLTQVVRLPAHDRASDPGMSAPSRSTPEPVWSGHIRIDPDGQASQKPLWKATLRGPRSAVAEQMADAILTQLRARYHPT